MIGPAFSRTWSKGKVTATAATKFHVLVPPVKDLIAKVTDLVVTAPALTTHTVTCLRTLGTTTVYEAALASATSIKLTANPGDYTGVRTPDNAIASGDYFVMELPDGTFWLDTFAGTRDGTTKVVNVTTALPTLGVSAGAKVWFLGVAADLDPHTAEAHPFIAIPTTATTTFSPTDGPLFQALRKYEPLVLQHNNPTTAGTIERASGVYAIK